ncbi:MAG: hypothetical protein F6J87_14725 [Spirulina sp. SIO3F2]|nr:hypothetical protein [Spirulina sp. SIO3F2]
MTKPIQQLSLELNHEANQHINLIPGHIIQDIEPLISLSQLAATQQPALPISFGWTSDRLPPKGCKSVTRRFWSPRTATIMQSYLEQGRILPAVDKQRCYGGKQIGWLKLNGLGRSPLSKLTWEDCQLEGYPELTPTQFLARFFEGKELSEEPWVVGFEYEAIMPEIEVA